MDQMLNSMPIYALYPSLSMVRNAESQRDVDGRGKKE